MKEFLHRAHRIVTNVAIDGDYDKTNIHACLAHVLVVSSAIYEGMLEYLFFVGCSQDDQQIHSRGLS